MVGGGNLVTALIGNVVTGYVILILLWRKRKDLLKYLAVPGGAMLIAFCVNIAAPGNWCSWFYFKIFCTVYTGYCGRLDRDILGVFDFNGTSCFVDNSR